ncbi:MAG: hypothetical protein H0X02_08630 [Nitrosomonas sp.]|nr:hypothetical protein [Nitrosomonas sp.]
MESVGIYHKRFTVKLLKGPLMRLKVSALLLCTWLPSLSEAQRKITKNVVVPIAELADGNVVAGLTQEEMKSGFIVMFALWVIREAYGFLKEKANKTGEKISNIEISQTKVAEKLDAFIKAVEKSEERLDRRVSRIEASLDDR